MPGLAKTLSSGIWSQLTGEKKTANRAAENIAKAIESKSMTEPIIMLADELGKLLMILLIKSRIMPLDKNNRIQSSLNDSD